MKTFFLIIVAIFISKIGQTQCSGVAGHDKVYCSFFGEKNLLIGNTLSPTFGAAPYTYSWHITPVTILSETYTISDFIDDSTKKEPLIVETLPKPGIHFILTVSDYNGNSCQDTLYIRVSTYFHNSNMSTMSSIETGDSARLITRVSGGIPPLQYNWTPGEDLSDSTIENPWAKPTEFTIYNCVITDSGACELSSQYGVYVYHLGFKTAESNISLSPNPMMDKAIVRHRLPESGKYKLILSDALGRLIREEYFVGNEFILNRKDLQSGLYHYQLLSESAQVHSGLLQVR